MCNLCSAKWGWSTQNRASQHNWGLCLPSCSNLSTCLASLVRCLPNFIFPFVLLIDRDPLQWTTLEMTFIWWFWSSGDDNDENRGIGTKNVKVGTENINAGKETIHTSNFREISLMHRKWHFVDEARVLSRMSLTSMDTMTIVDRTISFGWQWNWCPDLLWVTMTMTMTSMAGLLWLTMTGGRGV